jgi:hypothetical protein
MLLQRGALVERGVISREERGQRREAAVTRKGSAKLFLSGMLFRACRRQDDRVKERREKGKQT